MASTTFIDQQTVIYADWLNDVNNAVYNGVFAATTISPTNLVCNGSVSGTGFTGLVDNVLSAPGPIGSGTPNTGAFTTLTATSPIAVTSGGTGLATATGVLVGSGTSALTAVAAGTSGNILVSNGTTWTSAAVSQPIKSFAAFNGNASSPITARSSSNIASITRTGTGVYDVVFTTPLADANYAVVGSANNYPSSACNFVPPTFGVSMTANGFTLQTYNSNFSSLVNAVDIYFVVVR